MTEIGDSERTASVSPEEHVSYIRFDNHSTLSACSSIVLSSCSSDEENDDNHHVPPLKWKRQKILKNDFHQPEQPSGNNDSSPKLSTDGNSAMSAKENVVTVFDEERRSVVPPRRLPPIPADKLHRRNPHVVRQELRMLDDLPPETALADVHLSEMPGLQNTEQWKRIAGRTVRASPPLSRQYYQTVIPTIELQEGQVPQPLGSYRRPGRSETEHNPPSIVTSLWRAPRCRIFFGSSIAVIIVAIVVAVVLAVTLLQKSSETTTNYYAGSVYVSAKYDQVLSDLSSTMARNYRREFCSLVATTLADANTKYALFYSTCNVLSFRNGSIIADFILGFTRPQNVTRLNVFLNHSLVNTSLFGGSISSIRFNLSIFHTKNNNTNSTENDDDDYDYNVNDDSNKSDKLTMNEPNSTDEQQQQQPSTRTTYTTVTYTSIDKGLSITISETITITNNNTNLEKPPIANKNYELILVPSIDTTRTVVVPNSTANEETPLLQSLPIKTNLTRNAPSEQNLLRPIKPAHDTNFAYIDESSDDRTYSSGDAASTLEDLTTHDTATSVSTPSLNEDTLTDSTATLDENLSKQTPSKNTKESGGRTTTKPKHDSSEENRQFSSRPTPALVKRQRRMVAPKSQRRLLQYELMPTGKVYYVDRPFYKQNGTHENENSSVALSTILSRSSSLDTLSEKRYRPHPTNPKNYPDFHSLKKSEQKLSVGGRLASNNNLLTTTESSLFKPISSNKKKRFSSFEPTPESLDQVFDVLIEADKRREKHEFWKEKFEQRPGMPRAPLINTRAPGTTNSSTIPIHRPKQTQLTSNSSLANTDARSQSYTNKRTSSYEPSNQQNNCLLADCLRRRALLLQQQKQQAQSQRNYSPNTIYSTTYPKQQLPPTGKSPHPLTTSTNVQPVRILPLTNGRIGRAPQARQTSDELSSISDIWATRSSLEEEPRYSKKTSQHTRFQSTVDRNRPNEFKPVHTKRASSVEQQKPTRPPNKTSTTTITKSKFFDLFKFNR